MIEIRGVIVTNKDDAVEWLEAQQKAAKKKKASLESAVFEQEGELEKELLVIVWPARRTIDVKAA